MSQREAPGAVSGQGVAPPTGYIAPIIDERAPVPPCCAAMRSAVITAYRATWHENLRLIGEREYQRGLQDGRAGK